MKKLLMIAAGIALLSVTTFAQTEKGSLYVGGSSNLNMQFSKTSYEGQAENKSTYFSISPSVQYFVADNFAIGLGLPYSFSSGKAGDTKSVNNNIGLSPSLTYLFGANNVKPYLAGQVSFNKSFSSITIDGNKDKYDNESASFSLGGGLAYFFQERLAMNAGIYYSHSDLLNKQITQNGVSLRVGFMFRVNK